MLRFGTDGVRGRAYKELFPDDVVRLAQAAAEILAPTGPVVIGRDTRDSSPDFASALAAGFSAVGVSTIDMGVAPTPAVAWAAARARTPGAMVSASHNPWYDNGVKLFGSDGRKLDDDVQTALESTLGDSDRRTVPTLGAPQRTSDGSGLLQEYQEAVATTADFAGQDLSVVVDAANGSATTVLPGPLQAHDVTVTVINSSPNGRNINWNTFITSRVGIYDLEMEFSDGQNMAVDAVNSTINEASIVFGAAHSARFAQSIIDSDGKTVTASVFIPFGGWTVSATFDLSGSATAVQPVRDSCQAGAAQ